MLLVNDTFLFGNGITTFLYPKSTTNIYLRAFISPHKSGNLFLVSTP